MKKHILFLFVFFPSFLATSCWKDLLGKEHLPPVTQSGAQTFGCKVDGKIWTANGTHDLFVSVPALSGGIGHDLQRGYYFYLAARRDPSLLANDSYDDISFVINDFLQNSDININKTCPGGCGIYCPFTEISFSTPGVYCFITDSTHTGKLIFTRRDTVNRIVSGTFEFTAYDKAKNKTITITDGRFDFKE